MLHPSASDVPPGQPAYLHVRAGGEMLALAWEVLAEARAAGPLSPIPGSPPWLVGLTQWKGRLMTVADAGRLFGSGPSSGRWQLALKGLPCELALAVDELLGSAGPDERPVLTLDATCLANHPAFQRGAAGVLPRESR